MYELVCLTCQQFPVNCKAGDANHTNTQRSNPKHSTKLFVDKQWGIIIQRRGNSSTVKMESSTSPHLHFIYSPQKNAFHAPPQAKLLLPHNLQTTYTILPAETQAKKRKEINGGWEVQVLKSPSKYRVTKNKENNQKGNNLV